MAEYQEAPSTILFGESEEPHPVGDENCAQCWQQPSRCHCGGLFHFEFGDENDDCDYWLYSRCDKCGGNSG